MFLSNSTWSGDMRRTAVCCLVAGFVVHLTLGGIYSFGNLTTYVTSYLHERVNSHVTYTETMWAAALMNMGQGMALPLGGLVHERAGPRLACLLGCSVLTASVAVTCWAVQSGVVAFSLVFGLVGGLGVGLAYVVPLTCAMKWFPDNRGVASGIIVSGFGLGSLIFNWIQTGFLNPNNLPVGPDNYFEQSSVLDRVPSVFLVLAVVYAALQLASIFFIREPPQSTSERYSAFDDCSDDTQGLVHTTDFQESSEVRALTARAALRQVRFYQLCLIFCCNTVVIGFINPLWKSYGQTFIPDDHFLTFVGSMAAVFNCLGRVFWGLLYDRTSFKFAMLTADGLLCACFATLFMTPAGGRWMFALWVWLITGAFSATFCLIVSVTACEFGVKHTGAIYGLIFSGAVVYSPLSVGIASPLINGLGYVGAFFVQASIVIIGILATLSFKESRQNWRR